MSRGWVPPLCITVTAAAFAWTGERHLIQLVLSLSCISKAPALVEIF